MHVNVACIALLTVNWLLECQFAEKWKEVKQDKFFWLSIAFYSWYIIQLALTNHPEIGRFELEQKAALLCLPLIILSRKKIVNALRPLFFNAFVISITGALLVCMSLSTFEYLQAGDVKVFIYHALANQIGMSAIYLSMLCIAAALYIQVNIQKQFALHKNLYGLVLIVLSVGVVLLASKTQIIVYALLSLGVLVYRLRKRKMLLLFSMGSIMAVIFILLMTDNPVRKRYSDIQVLSSPTIYQKEFSPDMYFDGVAIRVVLARFGFEILEEKQAYLLGVSPGDNRPLLNDKIKAHHLYTGNGGSNDHGYLNYNYHNQYMEVLMACGIVGLLLLMALLGYLGYMGLVHRQSAILLFILLYAACFITESVLEREVGIVSFSLFFSVLLTSVKPNRKY